MRQWRDITGTGGRYQVSDDGYVRSMPDIGEGGRPLAGKVLRHAVNEKGYAYVYLATTGKTHRVHRLVAAEFVPGSGPQVNHKDGDKLNNRADNLEWCNNSHNHRHRYRVLGHVPALLGKTGINCANSKPVAARSVATREHVGVFGSAAEAARTMGIESSGISAAASGKLRSYKGYEWTRITREQYAEAVA